jgi:hypothetical protein
MWELALRNHGTGFFSSLVAVELDNTCIMKQRMKEFQVLPPIWCSRICRNAMNEACLERCAIKRDCSEFQVRKDLKLEDMPRFPETAGMTKEERFTSVTVYLAKIVDHLQGVPNEYLYPIPRSHPYRTAGSPVPAVVQVQDLLPDLAQAVSSSTAGEERESSGVGSAKMAEPAD